VQIDIARTDQEIQDCWRVMAHLRTHVAEDEFVDRVRRQMAGSGYALARLESGGGVRAVAGYRVSECLAWGKFLYVDDLVTGPEFRSKGYGDALLTWLIEQAREQDCDQFHLDSGVQRFGAHRFYLRNRMEITSHHFVLKL
jgi:GNAT superfamily N-acetyltransferase